MERHCCLKPRLYALSLPQGVYLPLGVNICPTFLNTSMGKRLRLYVFKEEGQNSSFLFI